MAQPPMAVAGDFNAPPEPEDENDFGGSEMIELNESEGDQASTRNASSDDRLHSQTDSLLGMSSSSSNTENDIEMANL